ncbi:hypothetical protein GCM10022389_26900 [Flavobacterium cheonanense]|uniref:DUF3300 domain-containing protein n=2 Tax=Flavobacterium cheonanense TaxID=706183 RepID=A0ABP7W284_9FLAO
MTLLFATSFAQDRTTVNATSSEISDNLDLRAIASIFGDSRDLEDFENRLNDPKTQISNLDLNNDNQVDYLRVIESVEGRTHLIVVQSVLGRDQFQDVCTVEVEKDTNNRVQVQVVGDVYMYGSNYIYEPVYVHVPVIYNHFWISNYRPYCSSWYWGYYPSYYTFWNPYPIFRYRHNIGLWINFSHHYNYVNYRRCHVAYNNYYGRRANFYERQYPNRSFSHRNSGFTNRYELDRTRTTRDVAFNNTRNNGNTRDNSNLGGVRNSNNTVRNNSSETIRTAPVRENSNLGGVRNSNNTVRNNSSKTIRTAPVRENSNLGGVRSNDNTVRNNSSETIRTAPVRENSNYGGVRSSNNTVRNNSSETIRTTAPVRENSNYGGLRNTSEPVRSASTSRGNSYEPSRSSGSNERSSGSSSRGGDSGGRGGNSGRR